MNEAQAQAEQKKAIKMGLIGIAVYICLIALALTQIANKRKDKIPAKIGTMGLIGSLILGVVAFLQPD